MTQIKRTPCAAFPYQLPRLVLLKLFPPPAWLGTSPYCNYAHSDGKRRTQRWITGGNVELDQANVRKVLLPGWGPMVRSLNQPSDLV